MNDKTTKMLNLLDRQRVIPVVVLSDSEKAVPLAQALVRGGLPTIEITLRTKNAFDSIRSIAKKVPEAKVGAGTVLCPNQFQEAIDSGAQFIVSPGITPALLETAKKSDVPWLPGAITPSEMMTAFSEGINFLKFFPAESAGGVDFLKSMISPLRESMFCPTGGISKKNILDYLTLSNVVCVGGSWITPSEFIEKNSWQDIETLAKEASLF